MKHLSYILALIIALCTISCTKERASIPLSNYLEGEYYVYRIEESWPTHPSWQDDYFFNASSLMDVLQFYGQSSGNIFDFDGSGQVDVGDIQDVLAGFGNTPVVPFEVTSAQVTGQFSSGWTINLNGFDNNFATLKVTPSDEGGVFIPETLNSFFIEGSMDGQNMKYFFYASQ